MPKYLFYPSADTAQDSIWDYTCDEWGKKQAVKYINGLHSHMQALADKKKGWRVLPDKLIVPSDLDLQAYFRKYEHHYVFFRALSKGNIGIMSILHESSDIPVRLGRDLQKMEE